MSAGYAARLKEYPNKGVCGLPETFDTGRALTVKLQTLVLWINKAQGRVVVLTGAGISTAAGIPDFRGPRGIWTLEKKREVKRKSAVVEKGQQQQKLKLISKKRKHTEAVTTEESSESVDEIDFGSARPTLTHRAITKLVACGKIAFCVTQNVDGLHRRSGLSKCHHAVLHGCIFTEKCQDCGMEHFRDYDIGGISFQKTGRECDHCSGDLRDTLLDWEDPLPEDDLERAEDACDQANLVICLGTSLRIEPAGSLPTRAKKFVIVNLQETPYDGQASLIIRAKVDDVMQRVMELLDMGSWDLNDGSPVIERHWKQGKTQDGTDVS